MNRKIILGGLLLVIVLGVGLWLWLGQSLVVPVDDGLPPKPEQPPEEVVRKNELMEFKSERGGFSLTALGNPNGFLPTNITTTEGGGDEVFSYRISNAGNLFVEAIYKAPDDTLDNWLDKHFTIAQEAVEGIKMVTVAGYPALQFDITGALDEGEIEVGPGFTVDSVRDQYPPFPTFQYQLYVSNSEFTEEVTMSTRYIVIDVGDRFLLVSYGASWSDGVVAEVEGVLNTLKVFEPIR